MADVATPAAEARSAEETARLETLAASTIRGLTIDAVEAADSGHPGLPMGMADAAIVLWTQFLKHNPQDPHWPDRDRFVLSAGHGSMLLYSLLHLSGYDLPMEELKNFRQLHSKTPGHPEVHHTPGVETTTGPLGQGIANAVGMALAEKHLAAQFNTDDHTIVDHYTYVIASDGDLMEGVSNEASSLAGHLGLGKLVVLYDDNHVTIDGDTSLAFSEDVGKRYEALGWHVQGPLDGHDRGAVADAIRTARATVDRPSLIVCKTTIGYGSPNHAGTSAIHSDALGEEEVEATKKNLGIPTEPLFLVPAEATALLKEQAFRGMEAQCEWQGAFNAYQEDEPEQAADFERRFSGELPDGWADDLPTFEPDAKGMATRAASGKVLGALVPALPELIGGSADLTPSNKTKTDDMRDFSREHPEGRYLRFGVREHGMGAVLNGLTLHGGLRGYGGTFLIFSDYMRPTIRLAALMETPVLFVFTHDSVGLGEDGPTHQPIEQLMSLRAIPNLPVFRPCDANETVEAWKLAIERTEGPSLFAFTRQNVPTLDRETYASAEGVRRGAYVLSDCEGTPDLLLLATGSEVHLALEAQDKLAEDGIATRVVSMPCWELFDEQDQDYRDAVLPPDVTARVGVEAGATLGWYKYVGLNGQVVGLDHFGQSAPWEEVYDDFGLTAKAVAEAARAAVGR
ncbi:MAG: transketolase [Rhodothermaceae bacterium]|nr:transketolase [Rhodothermaceae bacterium]